MGSLRQIPISFDPIEAVHMHTKSSTILTLAIDKNTNFLFEPQVILLASFINEWPIEEVTIVSHKYKWLHFSNMIKEFFKESFFVCFIKNGELAYIIFGFWGILKILNISSYNLPISNQETFPINNIGDHHDLVKP
jgi:hypothetical protein